MTLDVLFRLLDTFDSQDFMPAVVRARRLAGINGTSIVRRGGPVPTGFLHKIYERRAQNPRLRPALARQTAQLAQVASRFPDERWCIYTVENGGVKFTIFSNEDDVGRACLDFEVE